MSEFIDSHAVRVAMIQAVGGRAASLDGRSVYGIFDDDAQRVDFNTGAVSGRELLFTIAREDQQDARRGSRLEFDSGARYYVEDIEPHDAGLVRLILVAQQ